MNEPSAPTNLYDVDGFTPLNATPPF